MGYYLAVRENIKPHGFKHYEVSHDVYTYVNQLEAYIKYKPKDSNLLKLYPNLKRE